MTQEQIRELVEAAAELVNECTQQGLLKHSVTVPTFDGVKRLRDAIRPYLNRTPSDTASAS